VAAVLSRSDAATAFGERAQAYDRAYDAPGSDGHALRARLAVLLDVVGAGPGEALDAGMGPGRLVGELAARGWRPSGLDAAPQMVAVARRRTPEAEDRLVVGTIEAIPFPDEAFDLVVATGVLEYAELDRALRELARVLRPGGRAVVSYPNPRAVYGIWKTRLYYPSVRVAKRIAGHPPHSLPRGGELVPPERFRQRLADAGLEPELAVPTSFLLVPSPFELLLPGAAERLGRHFEGRTGRVARLWSTQVVYAGRKP
jgi:ubiquinone/menaquinone biosynthesis C-methylase UbiE